MTTLFDGVTGLLAGVFGSPVNYRPQSGPWRDVAGVLREAPIEVDGADGQIVRIEAPTWRVARNLVAEIRRGDHIVTADDRVFIVAVVHPASSPASDAFLICELQSDRAVRSD